MQLQINQKNNLILIHCHFYTVKQLEIILDMTFKVIIMKVDHIIIYDNIHDG